MTAPRTPFGRPLGAALAAAAALLAGCSGGEDPARTRPQPGDTLVVYASAPTGGPLADAGAAVVAGQRLALADAGGRAGAYHLRLAVLDAGGGAGRPWDPSAVSAAAERAADDPAAVAYLGDLGYGASAVSLPVTNEARLLQVSPLDGLPSLTAPVTSRPREAPERLLPSGRRSFVRLAPSGLELAEAIMQRVRAAGVRRLAILAGDGVYGQELGDALRALARRDGPRAVLVEAYDGRRGSAAELAEAIAAAAPDAVALAGAPGSARALLAELGRRLPALSVFAAGALPRGARLAHAPTRVELLDPLPPPRRLPARARAILRRLPAAAARTEAAYGYESAVVVLDAIRRLSRDGRRPSRARVVEAVLGRRRLAGVLGLRTLTPAGDAGGERFALWRLRRGRFELERTVG